MSREDCIAGLIGQMTLQEKVSLLAGVSGENYMDTTPIERLGIPQYLMADGPHGVRWDKATAFPVGICMAATWNPELMERFGVALAHETRAKGRNVILGPCICIHRTPRGGRNFESFGEDPYLSGRIAIGYVKGVQSQGVATSTKHFATNNQEKNRMTVSTQIDERSLREIYLPAFKAAVQEADTWTIMGAYNKLNGQYCCENEHLLNDILKKEWGFRGLVVSDWGAVHSTVPSAKGGLDLEMPGPGHFFNENLTKAVEAGEVDESIVDDCVRRFLRVMDLMGLLDGSAKTSVELDETASAQIALEMAEESIVLLKNDGDALPLKKDEMTKIAVIGPNAHVARLGGGGSSTVSPHHAVSPLEGIEKICGDDVEVKFAMGCTMPGDLPPIETQFLQPADGADGETGLRAEYYGNKDLSGEPMAIRTEKTVDFDWGGGAPVPGMKSNCFSARWSGALIPQESGLYELGTITTDEMNLYVDDEQVLSYHPEHAAEIKTVPVELEAGQEYRIRVEFISSRGWPVAKLGWIKAHNMEEAVELARESDIAIVVTGISSNFEGEGEDRTNLNLPGRQVELIKAVTAANPNTVVVLVNGTPLVMDQWIDEVPAIVEMWYAGQEGGRALANMLFGDVNPSGKIVTTFPKKLEDSLSDKYYPGDENSVEYADGIWVGYRYFEKNDVEPLFAFGHGLSYTTFDYSDLKAEAQPGDEIVVQVSVDVENTGECVGKEVVQLYVRDLESRLERPVKELKGFQKISLEPGEKKTVAFGLRAEAFSFYDPDNGGWTLEPGEFELLVGRASDDIRAKVGISL